MGVCTHSQYWWISSVVIQSCGLGVVVVCTAFAVWHFGVGIHSFGGLGGGSRDSRSFGLDFGMQAVVFISAIFSPIGAFLAELQPFLCLRTLFSVSTRDVPGLVLV